MSSIIRLGIATAVTSAIISSLLIGGPASGQPASGRDDRPVATPSGEFEAVAAGLVSGRLLYTTLANSTPRPVTEGSVTFYRLDPISGQYEFEGQAVSFDAEGDWQISGMRSGSYVYSAVQRSEYPSSRIWSGGERYITVAEEVILADDVPFSTPTVTVPPREVFMGRLGGTDRFDTGVRLTRAQIPTPDPLGTNIVIVNGLDYPDALSAGPLATAIDGAMLMVTPTSIPPVVAEELTRLNPLSITIVGGTGVVSTAVEAQLAGYVDNPATQLRRIAGADRYATSRAVLDVGFAGLDPQALLLATGQNFPDALAAGPAAGYLDGAVLLIDGSAGSLDTPTRQLVTALDVQNYIIGGTGTVSAGIEQQMTALSLAVSRLSGTDRFETSIQIAIEIFGFADTAFVANAFGFADALSAGPVAGAVRGPIYLTTAECIDNRVFDDLELLLNNELIVVGGTGVLAPAVEQFRACDGRVGPL